MTTSKNTATALVTGKGKAARMTAFGTIATQAYNAESSKAGFLATLDKALGVSPTPEQTAFARLETTIGIAAMRLPVSELPKDCTSITAKLDHVRSLVLEYQAPSQAVTGTVRKLNKGKKGWRSAIQHRIIRNAETRAGVYLAEQGAGNAKTDKQGNDAKAKAKETRAPQPVAATATAMPAHSVLVKPDKALDSAAYVTHMQTQLSALLAFDNANAKVRPITHSAFADALAKLRTMGNVAANAFAVANIETAGKAAEAETQAA